MVCETALTLFLAIGKKVTRPPEYPITRSENKIHAVASDRSMEKAIVIETQVRSLESTPFTFSDEKVLLELSLI